ncbi:MAG: hypothetical protein BWY36_00001 [Candidatus Diapherotrites archaeon ADurb.Bin253]|jgi:hypothetical protein|nr:MAG: hypothetical protein BWY36_00001 [Candidatus Diapherotrites archaeon ADurb.Bin253]HNZ52161.1 hypothetical protein [Candidatus Pacearchaeota archaeon]HOC96877.1 hypothetical protein [Candidatus Pacearchaeota archaeon]HOF44149.1 hypothetical protein [Candidatus Pacearchaeota archaeon]HOH04002.1 hypothetical protein [Candidatus Pacearchaeota archaeon]
MKKFVVLFAVFTLAIIAGCKKKVEPVVSPPPPPPIAKVTQQEFMKGLISMVPQLSPGEVKSVTIDKEKVISGESTLNVSLFPLEFIIPAEEKYIVQYMFPSVIWKWDSFQLEVINLEEYFLHREPGERIWILKESPKGTPPFKNIPTLLVENNNGEFWVLNQNGDEMPLRMNWGK